MRVLTVARVVRMSVIAAAVVAPSLAAARSNDPLAPKADAGRVSASGGSVPWYNSQTVTAATGGSVPWYGKPQAAAPTQRSMAGGSVPWYHTQSAQVAGGSVPWY